MSRAQIPSIRYGVCIGLIMCTGFAAGGSAQKGREQMAMRRIEVERFSVVSSRAFDDVVAAVEAKIGHPDMSAFRREVTAARNGGELEKVVNGAVGPSGIMEFARYDLGEILQKENGTNRPRIVRLVMGNPLIMKEMVKFVPDAGSYAPVTVLIDERADGVHLSYDRMASFLAPYGNAQALKVARELDAKIESMLVGAAEAK